MPALHFALAAIPVAIYFVLVGVLRLRKRPLVTTGWRDTLTLGIAASGLIAIGPMQLFFPAQAASRWHAWVWLALFVLYGLGLIMFILSQKPRLIAYGMDAALFSSTLLEAARQVDEHAAWNADVLTLPTVDMQLALEPSGTFRVHHVVHIGMLSNFQAWVQLERAFVRMGAEVACPRSMAGWPLAVGGLLLLALAVLPLVADPNSAQAQLTEFLAR